MKLEKKAYKFIRDCCIVLFAFSAVLVLMTIAFNLSFMNPVAQTMKDFSLSDIYYYVLRDHGRVDSCRMITIVDMTALQSRGDIADGIEAIESMNPKAVGVDIVFEGTKPDTLGDMRLMEVATKYQNLVFSYRLSDYANDSVGYTREEHSFFADVIPVKEGFTNFQRSLYGGVKRKVSLKGLCKGEERHSLVYEVAQLYSDGAITLSKADVLNVNFKPTGFRQIPYDSVVYHRDWIEGQIVLYGATHELYDTHYTPLGEMAGVELQAYAAQTLLAHTDVKHPAGWVTAILSFILVFITFKGRTCYVEWAKARKNEWLSFFLTTTFVIGFLLLLWTGFLAYLGFLLFVWTGICLNLGWMMAAIPFLGGAGEFFGLTIRNWFGEFRTF